VKIATGQYRNQRLGRPKARKQQHLLEVSIRRDKERSLRLKRVLTTMCKVILIGALAAGAWVGTREALQRFLWQNPFFYVTDIHVTNEGTLTREQILTVGGVLQGMHFLTIDSGKIRARLSQLPQVEHVEVQRKFPHRLEIEVTERQPVAWLTEQSDIDPTASDRAFLVDPHGYVMKCRKILPEYYHLPIISGAVIEDLALGQRTKALEIVAALELLHLNNDSTRWQIRNIDVSRRYCLVVNDCNHGQTIFGLDNIDRQLSSINRLLDYAEANHKELQTVNLLVERNIPVTFYDPDAPADAPAPPPVAAPPAPTPGKGKPGVKEKPVSATPKPKATPKLDSIKKPFRSHG
jgi:cell division protein FtsQ